MPPTELAAKVRARFREHQQNAKQRSEDRARPTFCAEAPGACLPIARLIGPVDTALLQPHREAITQLSDHAVAHRFDLLGSGWVDVINDAGLIVTDANHAHAHRIADLLPEGYRSIDWHADLKSGHRWDPLVWYRDQPQIVGRGIDVKMPWELSRMQHLPMLAWGFALANAGQTMPHDALTYQTEFQSQVLDFIAHNPPRFGVNWNCTMDVAIRAAGWAMTLDLFHALGAAFDQPFVQILSQSLREHVGHIAANLEWDPQIRGNHYLADVAGLLIASAYLPASQTSDAYLNFASRELIAETRRQFHEDGTNFEASTSYHRLSAEMVVYGLAVLQGVTANRMDALQADTWHNFRPGKPSPELTARQVTGGLSLIPQDVADRLARMAKFTQDLMDDSGCPPQIGDNDSGRFFKLMPATQPSDQGSLHEDLPNHQHLLDAADGFFNDNNGNTTKAPSLEASVVHAMLGAVRFDRPELPVFAEHVSYSGMGLYLYRHGRLTTIVRCGEVGQNGHGGHAHEDQLSFILYMDGVPIVVDPGTGCYTSDVEVRDRLRSVGSHNVLVADGFQDRSTPLRKQGLFRLHDKAHSRVCLNSLEKFVGEHTLFTASYQREFYFGTDVLECVEKIVRPGSKAMHFHLPGEVAVIKDNGGVRLTAGTLSLKLICADVEIHIERGVEISTGYGRWDKTGTRVELRWGQGDELRWSLRVEEPLS